ncbi:MAG: DUF3536 domain-containing protein, partial [candidate division Zixibacteria bacterium]|nr:DUF3536 domain-containing protein [candidate division Zixibacteria bacterium]
FTILAPRQAGRIRKIAEENDNNGEWHDVPEASVDPRRAYLCRLPSGRSINIFFYDGRIAQDIAFGDLLKNGEQFANRLLSAFGEDTEENQVVHIATDGETYGHHQTHGDMALAYCLYYLENEETVRLTNYGEFLENNPPRYEVEIVENSSWSCIHGVERWRNDCGCSSGMHSGWNQKWRAPLRGALDWLRDNLTEIYDDQVKKLIEEPWSARDEYIRIILNRADENISNFFEKHGIGKFEHDEKVRVLQLLEMQRHAMLMYTSCGWFFDEVSGLETVQVIQYAARAIQLARDVSGINLEDAFKGLLKRVPSNLSEHENAAHVYDKYIEPSVLDLLRVGAHYGISSLFKEFDEEDKIYAYSVAGRIHDRSEVGRQKLAIGTVDIRSDITWKHEQIAFAALHLGGHNILSGALPKMNEDVEKQMVSSVHDSFMNNDISEVFHQIDEFFENNTFSLKHLFKNEQRLIISELLETSSSDVYNSFSQLYDSQYPVVRALSGLNMPLPDYMSMLMKFILNTNIRRHLKQEQIDFVQLDRDVEEILRWSLDVDRTTLSYLASEKINGLTSIWKDNPENIEPMETANSLLQILKALNLDLNMWKSQVRYFTIGKKFYPQMSNKSDGGNVDAQKWLKQFRQLGDHLRVKIA